MLGLSWQQIAAIVLGIICLVLIWIFVQGRHWLSVAQKAQKQNDGEKIKAANIYILKNIGPLDTASRSNWIMLVTSILFGTASIVALIL